MTASSMRLLTVWVSSGQGNAPPSDSSHGFATETHREGDDATPVALPTLPRITSTAAGSLMPPRACVVHPPPDDSTIAAADAAGTDWLRRRGCRHCAVV